MSADVLHIIGIQLGTLCVDRSSLTLGKGYGEVVEVPVMAYALVGGEKKILVDTGFHDREWVDEHVCPARQSPEQSLETALLGAVGWHPEDVDVVINTHLHYDHCGGNRFFSRATFVVQYAEWLYAANPLPTQAGSYDQSLFGKSVINPLRLRLVSGFVNVDPWVAVFPTPGHSRGHQSVAVNTEKGTVVIAGDAVNLVENITDSLPPGNPYDIEQSLKSYDIIKRVADRVIPGHDWRVGCGEVFGFAI